MESLVLAGSNTINQRLDQALVRKALGSASLQEKVDNEARKHSTWKRSQTIAFNECRHGQVQ